MSVRITEDFEGGADGWSDPRTEDGGATFTEFLGRFGNAESGTIATQKTFDTSGATGDITIEFDFYEFDDWDGDTFSVSIDGVEIFSEDFTDDVNDEAVTATVTTSIGIVTYTIAPVTSPVDGAFDPALDQIHRVTITISEPTSDSFTLGFGGTFTADGEDFGIDNLTIERGAPADDDAVTVLESETTGDTDLNVLDNDLVDTPTVVEVNGSTSNVGATVDGSAGGTFTILANGDVDFSADGDFDALRKGESATTTADYSIEVQGAGTQYDLILMQDLSGSFSNDLPNVQTEFGTIFDTLATRGDDVGYGVASFVDKPIDPFGDLASGDFAYRTDQAVSTDQATTQATLDALATSFGNDLPESQLIALQQIALRADTAEIGFREGSERIVVLQTDAPFHVAGDFTGVAADDGDTDVNETEDYPTIASVATLLQAAGIRVIFAVTVDQIPTYETLLNDLGVEGSVVELTSTSSNLSSAVIGALDTLTTVETATVTVTVEGFDDEDGDGIDDLVDIDDDNDGILDINEGGINTQVDSGIDGALGINDGTNDNSGNDVTFQITSADPDSFTVAHDLDSITIDGVVYSDFILPDDYQASAPDGSQALPTGATVRLVENSVIQETILDPNYEDIILTEAFQSTNLNAYQELNGGDFSNAAYTLSYDEPILISAGGFIAITERGGNNSTTVTALDEFGNVLGTVTADQNVDYLQADAQQNSGQDVEIAVYALDDLGDVGRKISKLVVTFPDPVADQPDGKIFIFGDIDALRERDTDGDGIVDRLDIDSDNDGITDNVEAQTTQGYTALTGNDSDGDGLDDAYDADASSDAVLSAGLDPVDTDLDGTADVIDTDSDDDGVSDTDEAGHGVSQAAIDASGDADGDGLKDAVEGSDANDGFDVNDENLDATNTNFQLADGDNDTDADGSNAAAREVDFDYRDNQQSDDRVPNVIDIDDDNDGILDIHEKIIVADSSTESIAPSSATEAALTLSGVDVTFTNDGGINFSNDATNRGLTLNGGSSSASVITISFTAPIEELRLSIGDYDTLGGVLEFLDGFSVAPTSVSGGLELTGTGASAQVAGIANDSSGIVVWENLEGVTSISFTHNRDNAGLGVYFEQIGFTALVDTDGDGLFDHLDLDSDNDGITDNVEAQTTQGYIAPTGNDVDGDGLDDAYDADASSDAVLSAGLDPVDTDLDGTADFIDTDSDDDGVSDTDEAGHGVSQAAIDASGDADGDGLKDAVEGSDANDGFDVNDENLDATNTNFQLADSDNDTAADGSNAAPTDVDLDYRDDAAAPDAVDDTASTDEDTAVIVSVLTNDSDLDGDTLSVSAFGQGANGTVTDNGDGTLTYTPDADFNGSDSFTYTVSDGTGGTDTATVNVTVDPVNDAPDAIDDAASTDEETAVVISVLTNDVDVDGDTLSVLGVSQGANGSTVRNGDGTVTYTPDEGFSGTDTFNYIVSDGNGGADMATVTVTVNDVNEDPDAVDDTATTDEDTAVVVSVLTNDSDLDGDTLSVSAFGQGANGTVTDNGDGTLTYTPDADFNGSDSFTYTVSDGNGGTDTATVNVTVNPVNDDPVAADDADTTDEDTAVVVSVLVNDSDIDGDTLSVSAFGQGANGTVTDNGDGTLTYTPDADFNGSDSFTYTVSDGNGGTDTATVNVTVNPVNDDPVANDDTASTDANAAVIISVLTNDTDVDGDTLSVLGVSQGTNGSTVRNGDGTVTYTPDADFTGTDSFTYILSDGNGGTDIATVDVNVNSTNEAPDAVDDAFTTVGGQAAILDLLDNDSDPDGDVLTISALGDPTRGSVVDNGDGTVTYTPNAGFFSTDSFTYTISDGNGAFDTATVDITQNFAPIIPEPVVLRMDENETDAGRVAAFDFEADPITFSIAGGADAALFTIDAATGDLTFINAPDFENPLAADPTINGGNTYFVDVTAADPFASATSTIEVVVQDVNETVNEAPEITNRPSPFGDPAAAAVLLLESSIGVVVDIDATDAPADTLQYRIFGEDVDKFSIDEDTGEISLLDFQTEPDASFDNDAIFELDVVVEDQFGASDLLSVEFILFLSA